MGEVKCFICHQANINIIHGIAGLLGIPKERFFVNLDRYGIRQAPRFSSRWTRQSPRGAWCRATWP